MDETYLKVKGEWKYLYRAVDKAGDTVDFLLRAHRDKVAARALVQIFPMGRIRFLEKDDLCSEDSVPDSGRSLVFEA
jgi:hypothetical protein